MLCEAFLIASLRTLSCQVSFLLFVFKCVGHPTQGFEPLSSTLP